MKQNIFVKKHVNKIDQLYTGSQEKTIQESSLVPDSQLKPFNPDDLYQQDNTYGIYEDMLQDDQVSVSMQLKKDLVLGSGFDIVTDDESQDEIKSDLERALYDDTDRPLEDQLHEILTAYDFGFSISEKLFKRRQDGSLTWRDLKTRHPATWKIETDKHGNITKYSQFSISTDTPINPKSLIHYVNNPRFQNPYGKSDLRDAYKAWFTKEHITRYYGIFLEKHSSPTPVGRYDKNAPQSAKTEIFNSLKRLQTNTAMVIPKEIEIDYLQSNSDGEAYTKGINIFNMFIGRALFIPDLMGFQGEQTSGGSYSLGQEQMSLFFKHIERRRRTLEALINNHIIKPLVFFNFGELESFPGFKLKPLRDDDAQELAQVWLEAVKGKVFKANDEEINHFRSLVKFPEGEVQESEKPDPPSIGDPTAFEPLDIPQMEGQDEREAAPIFEDDEDNMKKGRDKNAFKVFDLPKGDFHKRVNFAQIESDLNKSQSSIINKSQPVLEEIFQDLGDQIRRKRILETQNLKKAETIKIKKLKSLNQIIQRELKNTYNESKVRAQSELIKGNFSTPLLDEKFLEVLEAETFQFVGDWEFNIDQATRIQLQKAIKDGIPLSKVLATLESEIRELGEQSIERFSRTKTTEVFNRGRKAFFDDSGVVAAYQYSAVLDDRTTAICSGLHGKIFRAGSEPVPPLHFNCRSTLIPITKFESFKEDKKVGNKNVDVFIEDNLGKGFSKQ